MTSSALILFAIFAGALAIYLLGKASADGDIHRKYGLSPGRFELLATDHADRKYARFSASNVAGIPDTLFKDRGDGSLVVGEFKNRTYRGSVLYRDYYQVVLYIGLVLDAYPGSKVTGVLAFKNHRVKVFFGRDIYLSLLEMRSEVLSSMKQGKPVNPAPLHKRMRVRLPA